MNKCLERVNICSVKEKKKPPVSCLNAVCYYSGHKDTVVSNMRPGGQKQPTGRLCTFQSLRQFNTGRETVLKVFLDLGRLFDLFCKCKNILERVYIKTQKSGLL